MPEQPLTSLIRAESEPVSLRDYEQSGGYEGLRAALKLTPTEVQALVKDANLRGRGGAGFPTGVKWSVVPMGEKARRPKYFVVNADEMEPGTMKDRYLMEGNPHQLIEGIIIAAHAIEAEHAFIFIRLAYQKAVERLSRAITEAQERGYLGEKILGSELKLDIQIHRSAGRYICGEETALLNALEGKRPAPRSKPPYPNSVGLWGLPTVVNNVETICNVPHILRNGADWYKQLSLTADGGTKIYGASGKVTNPGLWELPMGTPLRDILEHAGGMRDGYQLRGLLPGGASTDFLTPDQLDMPMDFATPPKYGTRLGTGTIVVLDDRTCPISMLISLEQFFARESCGWCTPCREGLPWVTRLLQALENGDGRPEDIGLLEEHTRLLGPGNTFCALAPGAMEPLQSALKYFREDFEQHVVEKGCPWQNVRA